MHTIAISRLAIASLVLGILAVFGGNYPYYNIVLIIIPCLLLGYLSLKKIKKTKRLQGKWLAITSITIGLIALLFSIIVIIADAQIKELNQVVLREPGSLTSGCQEKTIRIGTQCFWDNNENYIADADEFIPESIRKWYAEGIYDEGDFKIIWVSADQYTGFQELLRESKMIEGLMNDLNDYLILPEDINVFVRECGKPDAYYDPELRNVNVCYELFDLFFNIFRQEPYLAEETQLISALDATMFVLYHEIGHSLVHILELPITGKEEDAVDQLATVISVEAGFGSRAIRSADIHGSLATIPSFEDYADTHSLNQQRYFNLLCWVYGSDPERYSFVKDYNRVPQNRIGWCEQEYEQIKNSWDVLLNPYKKEGAYKLHTR